jgi:hypothetical protein
MMKVFKNGALRRVAAAGAVVFLAGCGGNGAGDPVSFQTALFGNPTNQPTERPVGPPEREYNCPAVDILEGTAAYRVGRGGGSDVSHQASIIDVARECVYSGSQFSLKVGVQGRMVIGTAGRAGSYTAPLRVVVKRGDKVVTSRLARISVSVPEVGGASFAHVEEGIVLPIGASDPADEYEVLVGFDTGGSGAARRRR